MCVCLHVRQVGELVTLRHLCICHVKETDGKLACYSPGHVASAYYSSAYSTRFFHSSHPRPAHHPRRHWVFKTTLLALRNPSLCDSLTTNPGIVCWTNKSAKLSRPPSYRQWPGYVWMLVRHDIILVQSVMRPHHCTNSLLANVLPILSFGLLTLP